MEREKAPVFMSADGFHERPSTLDPDGEVGLYGSHDMDRDR